MKEPPSFCFGGSTSRVGTLKLPVYRPDDPDQQDRTEAGLIPIRVITGRRLTAPDFASLINPGWIAPPLDSSSSANVLSLEDLMRLAKRKS